MKTFIPVCIVTIFVYWVILAFGASYPEYFSKVFLQPAEELKAIARLHMPIEPNKMWRFPETSQAKGVITYDKEKSWGDYTIYANTLTNKTVVVDMQGRIVHEWDTEFDPDNLAYPDNVTTERVFSDPKNHENIYAMYKGEKVFFNKYGIKKFDKESNVLWYNDNTFHHDMCFLGNGDILTYETELRYREIPYFPKQLFPIYEDILVFINSEGEIYRRISLIDAFEASLYEPVLKNAADPFQIDVFLSARDIFHANAMDMVPKHVAERFENIAENSVMLSFRTTDMIVFLDLDTGKVTWAVYGPWRRQHAVRFLKNGHIIMLDNQGNNGPGGRSRILEIDLSDLGIVWEYTGSEEKPFYTRFNGMIDILPNGNILVTETHSGRIFEVTREKEIVWDYYTSERIPCTEGTCIPSLVSAQRLSKEELSFLTND